MAYAGNPAIRLGHDVQTPHGIRRVVAIGSGGVTTSAGIDVEDEQWEWAQVSPLKGVRMRELPTNEEIKELTRSAFNHIDALNAGVKWRTCIPARENDSDVIISEALHRIEPLMGEVAHLRAELKTMQERAESAEFNLTEARNNYRSLWNAYVKLSKMQGAIKRAAVDVYDFCFEDDSDNKYVRHLRRVLKVLDAHLFRQPNGDWGKPEKSAPADN